MTDLISDDHGRPEPPMDADEKSTLAGFLGYQRATLEWKTRGLTDDALAQSLTPTTMTLGGLLGHLAYVEDFWFSTVLAQSAPPQPWAGIDWNADEDWDWHQDARTSKELWSTSISRSDAVIERCLAEPDALSTRVPAWGGRAHPTARWIMTHMIEEYARHNGHADLLREALDGETGE